MRASLFIVCSIFTASVLFSSAGVSSAQAAESLLPSPPDYEGPGLDDIWEEIIRECDNSIADCSLEFPPNADWWLRVSCNQFGQCTLEVWNNDRAYTIDIYARNDNPYVIELFRLDEARWTKDGWRTIRLWRPIPNFPDWYRDRRRDCNFVGECDNYTIDYYDCSGGNNCENNGSTPPWRVFVDDHLNSMSGHL